MQKSRLGSNTSLETCVAHKLLWRWSRASRSSSGPSGGSTTLYFGLVLVERRFDGRFQSRSAKWLEHVPKSAGGHRTLHCSIIRRSREEADRQLRRAADGDCCNGAS